MARQRFFTGDTVDQAVLDAAGYYGVTPEDIAFEEVEKRHGFVKRRRKVVIKVDPEAPTGSAEPQDAAGDEHEPATPSAPEPPPSSSGPAPGPRASERADAADTVAADAEEPEPVPREEPAPVVEAPTEPPEPEDEAPEEPAAVVTRSAEEREELAERVFRAMDQILELADLHVKPEVTVDGDSAAIDLVGPERDRLEEDDGELLVAFETILSRIVWRWEVELENVRVDSDGFRDRREDELRRTAREKARRVRESGESTLMGPLPPSERRVVHIALSEDGGVTTDSEGDGYMKQVRIRPA